MKSGDNRGQRLDGVKQIAGKFGVSERTVERWCAKREEKQIPILKVGGRYVAYEADLEAWTRGRT